MYTLGFSTIYFHVYKLWTTSRSVYASFSRSYLRHSCRVAHDGLHLSKLMSTFSTTRLDYKKDLRFKKRGYYDNWIYIVFHSIMPHTCSVVFLIYNTLFELLPLQRKLDSKSALQHYYTHSLKHMFGLINYYFIPPSHATSGIHVNRRPSSSTT